MAGSDGQTDGIGTHVSHCQTNIYTHLTKLKAVYRLLWMKKPNELLVHPRSRLNAIRNFK